MLRSIVRCLFLVSMVAGHAWAQCGNPEISPITGNYSVCGQLLKRTSGGFAVPSTLSYLKICPVTGWGACKSLRSGICDTTYPYTCYSYRYNVRGFLSTGDSNQWFNVYVWNDGEWWGSDRTPIGRVWVGDASFGWDGLISYALPRPLPPNPIYPANNVQAPASFTMEWESGMTPDRALANAPVTYDVWYKYWPYSSTEPANYTLAAAGMPCNPLPNGHCSTTQTNLADGIYKWYVQVNLNVSNYVQAEIRPAIISYDSTQTANGTFNVGYTGRLPGCCR